MEENIEFIDAAMEHIYSQMGEEYLIEKEEEEYFNALYEEYVWYSHARQMDWE